MATEFIHNAKQIHLDLIKGDWAIKREVVYKAQISEQEKVNQRQAGELKLEKEKTGKLTTERDTLKQQLGEQTLKTKQARLEIWAMRLAAALYLAGKIKGVLP